MLGKGEATTTGKAAMTGRFVLCDGASASSNDYGRRDNREEKVGCPADVGAEKYLGVGHRS